MDIIHNTILAIIASNSTFFENVLTVTEWPLQQMDPGAKVALSQTLTNYM